MSKKELERAFVYNESPVIISEQIGGKGLDIEVSPDVDIDKLTDGDNDPMFITVEALNESVTGNKNYYSKEILQDIKEQILRKKHNMYRGHVKDEANESPEPQVIWIGATVKELKGRSRLFVKGYVLPTADKLRTYVKKAAAVGKDLPVSVYGNAKLEYDPDRGVRRIKQFVLESIDWAREFGEGIRNRAGLMFLTSEMKVNKFSDSNTMDLKEITVKELKQDAPELVKKLEEETLESVAEMLKVKATDGSEKIVEAVKEMVDNNEALKKEKKELEGKVSEFETDGAQRTAEMFLREKVKNTAVYNVLKSMVVSEMKSLEDKTEDAVKAKVVEMLEADEVKALLEGQEDPTVIAPSADKPEKANGSGVVVYKD